MGALIGQTQMSSHTSVVPTLHDEVRQRSESQASRNPLLGNPVVAIQLPALGLFSVSLTVEGVAAPSVDVAFEIVRAQIGDEFIINNIHGGCPYLDTRSTELILIAGGNSQEEPTGAVPTAEPSPISPITPWFGRNSQANTELELTTEVGTRPRRDAVSMQRQRHDSDDVDLLRAQLKFNQFDVERKGFIEGNQITSLAEWLWTEFHLQAASPHELQTVGCRLVAQMQHGDGTIHFEDFAPWYEQIHTTLLIHKDSQLRIPHSPAATPSTADLRPSLDTSSPAPLCLHSSNIQSERKRNSASEVYIDIGLDLAAPATSKSCNWNLLPMAVLFALLMIGLQIGLWGLLLEMARSSISQVGSNYLDSLVYDAKLSTSALLRHSRNAVSTIDLAGNISEIPALTDVFFTNKNIGTTSASVATSSVVNSPHFLTAYAAGLVQITPELGWVGVGLADGSMYSAIRMSNGQLVSLVVDAQNTLGSGTDLRAYEIDNVTGSFDLNRVVTRQLSLSGYFDPRDRPWYSETVARQQPTWSSLYVDRGTGILVKTATAPVWDRNKTRIIGVIAADCYLNRLSRDLDKISVGKSGAAFVTESQPLGDTLLAATSLIHPNVSAHNDLVLAEDAEDDRIRQTYRQVQALDLPKELVEFKHGGVPRGMWGLWFSAEPMIARTALLDVAQHLEVTVWITMPDDDFYTFVLGLEAVALGCCVVVIGLVSGFVFRAGKLVSLSQMWGWKKISGPVIGVFLLGAIQLGIWLVTIHFGTQSIAQHALDHRRSVLAREFEFRAARIVHRQSVTSMVYQIATGDAGLLLEENMVLKMNPALGLHQHSSLMLNPHISSNYIGLENGEYYEMRRQCRFSSTQSPAHRASIPATFCNSTGIPASEHTIDRTMQFADSNYTDLIWARYAGKSQLKGKSSKFSLKAYETIGDPRGSEAKVGRHPPMVPNKYKKLSDEGVFSGRTQLWYIQAAAAGRVSNNSRFGRPVFSPLEFCANGQLILRISQAFYNTSGGLVGVIGTTSSMNHLSTVFNPIPAAFSDPRAASVIIESRGEVVFASDQILSTRTTSGGYTRINVTSSPHPQMAAFTTSEWMTNHTISDKFTSASGWFDFSSELTKSSGLMSKCMDNSTLANETQTDQLESARILALNGATCRLSMIEIVPRHVFFSSLDSSISQAFTYILFGLAMFLFLIVNVFTKSKDHLEAMGVVRNHSYEDSKQIKKRQQKNAFMFHEIRERMALMRARWDEEPTEDSVADRNREKTIEYMQMADGGRDAYQTFVVETTYGGSSAKFCVFYLLDHQRCRNALQLLFLAFVLAEFLPVKIRFQVDGALLSIFTFHAVMKQYSIGRTDSKRHTLNRWLTITLFVGLYVLEWCTGLHDFLGASRPILIMVKSRGVRAMWRLMWKCIYSARIIVVLFFTVTAVTAVMGTLLFATKFDPVAGRTVDNFLESFVASFVFLVSLENYGFVYQGYSVTKMTWTFFLPISVIGVFFLTSMVIARFELAYAKYKRILSEFDSKQRRFAIAVAFALSTNDELESRTFVDMICAYWQSTGVNVNGIRDRMAQIQMAASPSHSPTGLRSKLDSATGPLKSTALMIFDMIDRDNSLSISFDEFELVVAVSKCVEVISDDAIVGFQTIACRMELLLKESRQQMARLAPDKAKAHARVLDQIERHEFVFEQAIDQLSQCKMRIHGSVRLTRYFTMASLDQVTMVALIVHMFVLSLYGTTEGEGWVDLAAILFCSFYTAEMCCRLAAAKSWRNFYKDPRGIVHSFRNNAAFVLWLVGIITTFMALFMDGTLHGTTLTAVSSLAIWRIFVVSESFREIVFSCFRGLGAVSYLFSVFMIFFYFYTYTAHLLFRDLVYADDNVDFSTFDNSCLTMVQVCLGEGWHEIMYDTVDRTNMTSVFLFASFVFLVIVVFSQLFIGIVIQLFQSYEGMRSTFVGQCSLAFMAPLADTSNDQRDDMLKELGRISAILYAPELLHFARLGRYQNKIRTTHNGDTLSWASALVGKSYRNRWQKKWLTSFRHSVNVIAASKKWTRTQLVALLHEAWRDCGMDCNRSIRSTEHVFLVVKRVCKNFGHHVAEAILHNLIREIRTERSQKQCLRERNLPMYFVPQDRPWSFVCLASFVTHRLAVFSGLNPDLGHMYVKPSQDELNDMQRMHVRASSAASMASLHGFSSSSTASLSPRSCLEESGSNGNAWGASSFGSLSPLPSINWDRNSSIISREVFQYTASNSTANKENPIVKDPPRSCLKMRINTSMEEKMAALCASRSPVDTCNSLGRQRSLSSLDSRFLERFEEYSPSPSPSPSTFMRATSSVTAMQWERVFSSPSCYPYGSKRYKSLSRSLSPLPDGGFGVNPLARELHSPDNLGSPAA